MKLSKGQSIVEAIVVVSIVVVLVTGLIAATTFSLKSVQGSRVRAEATKYAEETLENMRSLRDAGWDTFQTYTGEYCYPADKILTIKSGSDCPVHIVSTIGDYVRTATFSWDGEKMTVTSKVVYVLGSVSKDVTLVTYFTRWR